MQLPFVHLRAHSEFSLVDGLLRIDELMATVPVRGMNAIAVTDYCNLFAVVKIYKAAIASGIKPIFGAEVPYCTFEKPDEVFSMVLLCQNLAGYRHLTQLISKTYQEGQYQGKPRARNEWFSTYADGIIALSGARRGDIGRALLAGDTLRAEALARHWMSVYPGRFYIELQRTDRVHEDEYNALAVQLADSLNLPIVATNEVCFLDKDDFEAHEARVCIHDGSTLADPRRERQHSQMQYLRSAEEMAKLFHDLPQALQNSVEISKRCTVKLELGQSYLPNFPTPPNVTIEAFLIKLSQEGLEKRLIERYANAVDDNRAPYDARLQTELEVINAMGFAGYFLIVADFIRWALSNGVPVGPGRGSGAGSLVAYALRITDLDPLAYDLLFERFLNPERVSMPDFDIDFCMDGRDRVIDYVASKYGRQSVSQIITFGTMAAKAVVRDVGRVLSYPYGFVDKLAKLIPFEIGITLEKALQQEEVLAQRYEEEEEVKELFQLALKLEGITRNAGKHAGGVVIAPSELTDFSAIYCEEGSTQIVSQFDKDDVEAVGLVKFDFLGLRTLTIIDKALKTVNYYQEKAGLPFVDIGRIPLNCPETFTLLKHCQTTAVFQLESRGMKELIGRLQPDTFEDIIALVALFRPGPLQSGMVDDFIDRKHGRAKVAYLHPDLESILKPTYGVILYQEQVMQIAQVLANYTLGAADLLRRAMGKKKLEEMAQQRKIFSEGAETRGIDSKIATTIFDLMEKFAGYGFNKSHSAAYALVAYQTAWLKAHYPAAFMAAVLSSDMDNTDKVVIFVNECRAMTLQILAPSVNQSYFQFSVNDAGQIVYGLGAIKGVGEAAIQAIVQEREARGCYKSLFEFCQRFDLRKVNRRVLETLIKSGACDEWGVERAVLFASLDVSMQGGVRHQQNAHSGQLDLFALLEAEEITLEYAEAKAWSEKSRLEYEKETLGYYLTGHPSDVYCKELTSFITPIAQLNPMNVKKAIICGLVVSIRTILTKRNKKLVILGIEDACSRQDVLVFAEQFVSALELIKTGDIIVLEGELGRDDFNGGVKMIAQALYTLHEARTRFAKCLRVNLKANSQVAIPTLQAVFRDNPGQCVVQIYYSNESASAAMMLSKEWRVSPSEALISALNQLFPSDCVELLY
jgi:DNA polymerase-3 subunit alpha